MQTGLHHPIGEPNLLHVPGPLKDRGEECQVVSIALLEIGDAGIGTNQKGSALAKLVLDHRLSPIGKGSARCSSGGVVGLQKSATPDRLAIKFEGDAIADIGHEFDVLLADPEHRVETVMGLDHADLAAVAE